MTTYNIIAGFCCTRIYPFDEKIFKEYGFFVSAVTNGPKELEFEEDIAVTSEKEIGTTQIDKVV